MVKSSNELSSDSWKTWVSFRIPPRTLLYSSSTGRAHNWIGLAMSACSAASCFPNTLVYRSLLFSLPAGAKLPAPTAVNIAFGCLWCWILTTTFLVCPLILLRCVLHAFLCRLDFRNTLFQCIASIAFHMPTNLSLNFLRMLAQVRHAPSWHSPCSIFPRSSSQVAFTSRPFATLNILWLTLDALNLHPPIGSGLFARRHVHFSRIRCVFRFHALCNHGFLARFF